MPRTKSRPFPKIQPISPSGRGLLVADLLARRLVELSVPADHVDGASASKRGRLAAQEAHRGSR